MASSDAITPHFNADCRKRGREGAPNNDDNAVLQFVTHDEYRAGKLVQAAGASARALPIVGAASAGAGTAPTRCITSLPEFDMSIQLPVLFAQAYRCHRNELPEGFGPDDVTWESADIAVITPVPRPIARAYNPEAEAREAVARFAMMLDAVIRAGKVMPGYGFIERGSGRCLFVEPQKVRQITSIPIIPVAYQVHKFPHPDWLHAVIHSCRIGHIAARAIVTPEAFRCVCRMLDDSPFRSTFTYPQTSIPGASYSILLPSPPDTKESLPPEVRACIAEEHSVVTQCCVVCKKKAKMTCANCGAVMYCSKKCMRAHKTGHKYRC